MNIIGAIFNSGMALPKTAEEVKSLINSVEGVVISKFVDIFVAYVYMMQEYEKLGIPNKILLPAPTLEDLAVARFFSTESFDALIERNKLKHRWFTIWGLQHFGIFDDVDKAVDAFFSPGCDFILTEVKSPDEAVNDIFRKYASVVFPIFPYCNGIPVPMLNQQFAVNVLVKAPYIDYLATNCVIPQKLQGLLPPNSSVSTNGKFEIAGVINDKEGGNT